jgi:hypothetical protein
MYAEDCARGDTDWAYVDLLMIRQEMNAQAPFAGDAAIGLGVQHLNSKCGCTGKESAQ